MGMLTYHIKTDNNSLDPIVGAGVGYTIHKWYWETFETNGIVKDINVGGGFGLAYNLNQYFQMGLLVFLYNGFDEKWIPPDDVRISRRKLIVYPIFELNFKF